MGTGRVRRGGRSEIPQSGSLVKASAQVVAPLLSTKVCMAPATVIALQDRKLPTL